MQKEKNARAIQAKLISENTKHQLKCNVWIVGCQEANRITFTEMKGVKHKPDCVKDHLKFCNIVLQQQVSDTSLFQTFGIQARQSN